MTKVGADVVLTESLSASALNAALVESLTAAVREEGKNKG